jgi:hypothetical protein
VERDAPVDQGAAVAVTVAQVEAERAERGCEAFDLDRREGHGEALVESYADDRHRVSDVVEGDRQDLRRVEVHACTRVADVDALGIVVLAGIGIHVEARRA